MMLRAVLELIRILVMLALVFFIVSQIQFAILRLFIQQMSDSYYLFVYLNSFILFFILYRNKLQFTGWYSKYSIKLSRGTTYTLFSVVFVSLLIPILLSSCVAALGQDLSLLSMNKVQDELAQTDLQAELSGTPIKEQYELDRAEIQVYDLDHDELLYVYVFPSEEDSYLGQRAIKQQTELIQLVYTPHFYTAKNALFIYMKKNETDGQAVDQTISQLVEALE